MNVWLLRALMRYRKLANKPLCLAFLDIRKAFDTVSHKSLLAACARVGIPPPLIEYIRSAHMNAYTTLKEDKLHRPIRVTSGVKQGDPPASFLFNLTMELVCSHISPSMGVGVVESTVSH